MRKKEIEKLDKLNEEKKFTIDVKDIITEKILNNFFIALDILLLFIILIIAGKKLSKDMALIIYRTSSIAFLIFAFCLFEISYKKENDEMAINGIELLLLSITVLLTPYFLIEKPKILTSIMGVYFSFYYIVKNVCIYKIEKNKFLKNKSDINQIIKKESQDEMAKVEKEKIKSKDETKRKRGRPKKTAIK